MTNNRLLCASGSDHACTGTALYFLYERSLLVPNSLYWTTGGTYWYNTVDIFFFWIKRVDFRMHLAAVAHYRDDVKTMKNKSSHFSIFDKCIPKRTTCSKIFWFVRKAILSINRVSCIVQFPQIRGQAFYAIPVDWFLKLQSKGWR